MAGFTWDSHGFSLGRNATPMIEYKGGKYMRTHAPQRFLPRAYVPSFFCFEKHNRFQQFIIVWKFSSSKGNRCYGPSLKHLAADKSRTRFIDTPSGKQICKDSKASKPILGSNFGFNFDFDLDFDFEFTLQRSLGGSGLAITAAAL